jgi:hypothetical protein
MADNIKIIGNINDIQRISRVKIEDQNLLNYYIINQSFGYKQDYIEFFVYDLNKNLIYSNNNYKNFKSAPDYKLDINGNIPIIEIDPINDIQSLNYISGEFISQYNFFKSTPLDPSINLFIQEISDDRTEIRINSADISSDDLIIRGEYIVDSLASSTEQKTFLFNQFDNNQILVVNAAIDENSPTPSILLKLYNPLPSSVYIKSIMWITEEIIEPYVFNLNLDTSVIPESLPQLKGPNFNIDIDIKQNIPTKYESYSTLVSSLTGSSYHKVLNFMNDKSYDLNVDYTSFNNFIHFSSAEKRLEIFYNKVKQIEDYNNNINIISSSNSILKNNQTYSYQQKIDNIISKFDGFEYYLYFESSSFTWPKSGSNKPYILLSTGSLISKNWYGNYTSSAQLFDENNLDHLYNMIPNYIKNDPDNYQPYYDFIDMIGHYFDNIWIYISSINDLYNANNNLKKGISKDIVYDALRSLGVKLYNSKGNNNFTDYISGFNSGSSIFVDDFSVTSSFLNNIPKKDQLAELYKRIYHNIPLLSKTKGTTAGLQNLITSFGVTSSIFSPKEFGGSTKKNIIKGYVTDKVVIQNNTITGSVLSPFISLQQPFTGSSDFISTDLHFVDLSFSPQNQLNNRISASIASTFSTFSLDDYVGDPRLYSSSSYNDLNTQKDFFISASAAISGSAKRLDYKGFFELVKYFDNSLFKMLEDFVPARTNTLTGITIQSPILERNKIATYRPNVNKQTTYDAKYNGPVISEDNDYIYDKLTGTKSSFYDGNITGSYISIDNYFTNSNPNPYLFPTSSIDTNLFNHTDFNITLNNVSSSIKSINRFKLEDIYTSINKYIFKNTSAYSSSAELQDSYGSLLGHSRSRYDGTKISSLTYNTYTSASSTYNGDTSYGKTAVIDHYTRKLGLFSQVKESLFFDSPKRNNIVLKYLVDESGNLTELNKKNKHWCEVQNTFKNNNLTITLFDSQKFSNQKTTNGVKPIYNSGYSYSPILYFTGSLDTSKLFFAYSGEDVNKLFQFKNTINGYINGTTNPQYPLYSSGSSGGKVVYNAFDIQLANDNSFYTPGSKDNNTYPYYTVPSNGNYAFNVNFDLGLEFAQTNQNCIYQYDIIKGSLLAGHPAGIVLGSSGPKKFTTSYLVGLYGRGYNFTGLNPTIDDPQPTTPLQIESSYFPLVVGDNLTLTYNTDYIFNGSDGNTYKAYLVYWSYDAGDNYIVHNTNLVFTQQQSFAHMFIDSDYITNATSKLDFINNKKGTLSISIQTPDNYLSKNDTVYFKLSLLSSTTTNFTSSFTTAGSLKNSLSSNIFGNAVYATGSATDSFISMAISSSTSNLDTIVFNTGLSAFYNYSFLPTTGSLDLRNLYTNYGEVEYPFNANIGDTVIIYWSGQSSEFSVKNTFISGSNRCITLDRPLPGSLSTKINSTSDLTPSGVDKFLLLKKIPDETNIITTFNKNPGETSLGLIIPDNIHPDVLNNIDTITREINQKLVDSGLGVNGSNF